MIDCPTSKVDKEKVIFIKLGGLFIKGSYSVKNRPVPLNRLALPCSWVEKGSGRRLDGTIFKNIAFYGLTYISTLNPKYFRKRKQSLENMKQ